MKKVGIILLASLLVFSLLAVTTVQAQTPDIPSGDIDPETGLPKGMPSDYEDLKNKTESKWEYLSKEWPKILLENPIISKMNSFFKEISIVFLILFGQPYSFSMTLLGVVILWIFIALQSGELINSWGVIRGWPAYIGGVAAAVILSQIQLISMLVDGLEWLVFAKKEWWWNLIMIVVIIIGFILVYYFSRTINKWLEERRKKLREEETEQKQKEIKKFTKGAGI